MTAGSALLSLLPPALLSAPLLAAAALLFAAAAWGPLAVRIACRGRQRRWRERGRRYCAMLMLAHMRAHVCMVP